MLADTGPPITEVQLAAFEARHGLALPADYRAFLLRYNGGRPSGRDAIRLRSLGLLGLTDAAEFAAARDLTVDAYWDNYAYDLEAGVIDWREGGLLPSLLPIGGQDATLILRLDGEDCGSVWFAWDPDGVSYQPDIFDPYHCDRLAGSFGEWLAAVS